MLEALTNDLKVSASFLEKAWQDYTIDELANLLCEALDTGDEFGKDSAMAGLMLHLKPYIVKLATEHGRILKLEPDDFAAWMFGAIMQACDPTNRLWQKKKVKAITVIIQILNTRYKAAAYYESNLALHKANYGTASLDAPIQAEGLRNNEEITLKDTLPDEHSSVFDGLTVDCLIQSLIDDNKIVEAIIAETIAYNDCQKRTKKTIKEVDPETNQISKHVEYYTEFWPYRVVQHLNKLPENYGKYFSERYDIPSKKLDAALSHINSSTNQKLYTFLRKTRKCLRSYIG